MSTEHEPLHQETLTDNAAETASDSVAGDTEEAFEEFTLDDIEVIESKVFG